MVLFGILSNVYDIIQVVIEGIILFFIVAWLEKRKKRGG